MKTTLLLLPNLGEDTLREIELSLSHQSFSTLMSCSRTKKINVKQISSNDNFFDLFTKALSHQNLRS